MTSRKIETVTDLLESRILGREWLPKESLPPQGQLSKEYGVSLGTIAIAIRNLQQRRLVNIIPNKGAYVREDSQEEQGRTYPSIGIRGSYVLSGGEVGNVLVGDIVEAANTRQSPLLMLPRSAEGEDYAVDHYRQRGIKGVIFLGGESQQEALRLRMAGFPVILAHKPIKPTPLNYIDYGHAESMQQVIDLFVAKKHRRIAVLFPRTSMPGYYDTLKPEFLSMLAEKDLVYPAKNYWRYVDPANRDEAIKAIADLLSMPEAPTAIFAWSPKLAALILEVSAAMGLRVPEDLSVAASCYESEIALSVSGFVLPHRQLGECLLQEICENIENPFHCVQKLLPLSFIDKQTIAERKIRP